MEKVSSKIFKVTVTICAIFSLFLSPCVCSAKTKPIEIEYTQVGGGYSTDGVPYSLFITGDSIVDSASPQTIIKIQHKYSAIWHAKVTPPSVLHDPVVIIDGVRYYGDLYLQSWNYEPKSIVNPTGEYTSATYKGTLHANV